MKDDTNCVNEFQPLCQTLTPSSSPVNSSPAISTSDKMSNPKTNDQTWSERYVLDFNKLSITEYAEKSEKSASKNDIGMLTQAECLGKESLPEKALDNSGTYLELGPQIKESELSSETLVVTLHNEDPKPSKNLSFELHSCKSSFCNGVQC
jgi:heme-binding NEAT domain protein